MRRDWDVIRLVLAKVEEKPGLSGLVHPRDVAECDPELVSYHIRLLMQAGLVEGTCQGRQGAPEQCAARNLTWAGHELLDKIRSETVWNRVRELARQKGLELSFEVVRVAAATVVRGLF